MAYIINNKKRILEQQSNNSWLSSVFSYFNKMDENQKKAVENTIILCNSCKSNPNSENECNACKSFYESMKKSKINESKKIKLTESQFNRLIKKTVNESKSLTEEKKCGYDIGDICNCPGNKEGAVSWSEPRADTSRGNACAKEGYYCNCGRNFGHKIDKNKRGIR